jgi:predicted lactoylglutathione lyase
MTIEPFLISLPIADRLRSYAFYQEALGLEAIGDLADDGVPEPLLFVLNEGVRMMLVPTGGFGWVIGDARTAATAGTSECVLSVGAADEDGVVAIVERARTAGATVVTEPGAQPWGFAATFTDPDDHLWMVTVAPA